MSRYLVMIVIRDSQEDGDPVIEVYGKSDRISEALAEAHNAAENEILDLLSDE